MTFQNDIFISYAHADNEILSLRKELDGWVDDFHRSLEIRLKQLIGDKPRIWRDPKLQGNDYFGDEISDQLPGIALLISILSPRYVKSKWCIREVNEFVEASKANLGLRIGNKSRIFKVVKTKIDRNKHPEEIRGLLGYNFFREDENGNYFEFNKIFGEEAEIAYWTKLEDLARDIAKMLEEIPNSETDLPVSEITATIANNSKGKVYLAECSYDLLEARDKVKRELQANGYEVLPESNLLDHLASEYQQQVKDILLECDFAIQFFGKFYGKTPEDSPKSIVELQNDIAAEVCKEKGIERYIWIDPGLKDNEASDMRQPNFVETLKANHDLLFGADIFENSIDELRVFVIDKLQALEEKKKETLLTVTETGSIEDDFVKDVYIICDKADRESKAVNPLKKYLFNQGFDVILSAFKGDEDELREDHIDNLKTCDSVIIFYGHGDELWMRSKDRELKKVMGYGRKKAFDVKAVYLADPDEEEEKEDFLSRDLMTINALEGKQPEDVMKDFIQKLKTH